MFEGFFEILQAFEKAGAEEPLQETLNLMNVVSNGAVTNMNDAFSSKTEIDLQTVVDSRKKGVPIEYALKFATFMGMRFSCTPAALIPRQETELLARTAIEIAESLETDNAPLLIVDIGTGAGNIAVSIAAHVEKAHILACDISAEAIELARVNVDQYGFQSRISLFKGDLFAPFSEGNYQGSVDMVVCNPPYIPTASLAKLASEITDHEPIVALDAGAYGIDIFRGIISQAPLFLKPKGVLVFEIGEGQDKFVTRMLQKCGDYRDIRHHADKAGAIRVISATSTPQPTDQPGKAREQTPSTLNIVK